MKSKTFLYAGLVIALGIVLACTQSCTSQKQNTLDGHWRAVWMTSGGEIPVDMYIKTDESGQLEAEVHNMTEVVKFDRVKRIDNHIDFYIDRYECVISVDLAEDNESMSGTWSKQTGIPNKTPFTAVKGDMERFPKEKYMPLEEKAVMDDISGTWKIIFKGEEDSFLIGSFKQDGERLTANIRSTIGDLRYLEGVYRNGLMLLSCFNGTWVFIFKAELDENGVLNGIWARGPREPYEWTATKEECELPDPFSLTKLTNEEGFLRFKYPLAEDPDRMISNSDPEFHGSPLLVAFTMTGCPNSHDNAELLSQMYKEYHEKGLNILAINYEIITDVERIQSRVKRFKEEHNLPFPVLYSFAMSKAEISKEIPDFERFLSWPTVAFYGPDGKVDSIHTGMTGPATGKYYEKLVNEYRSKIEKLLPKGRNKPEKKKNR